VKLNGQPDLKAIVTVTENKRVFFFVILQRAYHTKLLAANPFLQSQPTVDIKQHKIRFIYVLLYLFKINIKHCRLMNFLGGRETSAT
jgi:hypothetical protein